MTSNDLESGMTPEQKQRLIALEYECLSLERQNARLRYMLQIRETSVAEASSLHMNRQQAS